MTAIEIPRPAAPPVPRAPAAAGDPFPRRLRKVIARAYPDRRDAVALVREFLDRGTYDAAFAAYLIDAGRGAHGEDWPLRLLAARMLESQVLAIPAADLRAHRAVFDALAIEFDRQDGYTATGEAARVAQFRARLSRFGYLHRGIDGMRTRPRALERFLDSARRPCRVAAARYLFTLDETLERIYGKTRQSRGLRDRDSENARGEKLALAMLPFREAKLARALSATHEIFWVGEHTPSEINSLLEYPLGTVALVIKPPGSDVEIELKRAGIRGPRAWDVLYTRNSSPVCSSHYLQGGAVGSMLEAQSGAEARFAAVWRIVHGEEAPVSRTLRVNNVFKLPLDGGGYANVIRYFTDPNLYGAGYAAMRRDMALALDAMLRFEGEPPYHAPNDIALTGRFLAAVKPGQALQINTSSFRLDRIARYLRPDGARSYHAEAGLPCDLRHELLFADELLSEILPGYTPPSAQSRSYAAYIRAAFAVPSNRAIADRNFLHCARETGKMFGTCVGLCIGSGGESYVPRNVGLRSVFEDGQWTLRMIFMDHDALNIPDYLDRDIFPQVAARMMWFDYIHIMGGRIDPATVRGSMRLLAGIFHVSPAVQRAGTAAFHEALAAAHRAAREALPEKLLPFFHPKWAERLEDFDTAVRTYVRAGRATRAWAATIPTLLGKRRQTTKSLINQYIRGIGAFGRLWRRMPYLLDPNGGPHAAPAPAVE